MYTLPQIRDIQSCLLLLRTYTCLCQLESRSWRADKAQRKVNVRLAHDARLPGDEKTKQGKKVRHLDRTARKKQGQRSSSQLQKSFVSILDRLNEDDRYRESQINISYIEEQGKENDVFGSDDHTYNASSNQVLKKTQMYSPENKNSSFLSQRTRGTGTRHIRGVRKKPRH